MNTAFWLVSVLFLFYNLLESYVVHYCIGPCFPSTYLCLSSDKNAVKILREVHTLLRDNIAKVVVKASPWYPKCYYFYSAHRDFSHQYLSYRILELNRILNILGQLFILTDDKTSFCFFFFYIAWEYSNSSVLNWNFTISLPQILGY